MIEVGYHHGLYLPEPDLWLDPRQAKPSAFVSHAHADHFARHEEVICSEMTAALLQSRFGISSSRLHPLAFHVPLIRNGFRFRLLPAGHIPGSAMLHVTRISDNATLLYTGDFKTRRSRTSEPVSFLTADTLILETTFGLPAYEFPNPMEVEAEVLRFVHESFEDDETPVLLGYSLGKAQEALALLHEHEIPALLHPSIAAMTEACRECGVPGLPEPVVFDGHAPPGHVVIAPPHSVRSKLFKGLKTKRTAMLSGWALQPGAKFRYGVDAMIPFSDHADYPGLMECVRRVRPRRVLTVHGYEREFAADLRSRNIDAWSAAGGDQLELAIQQPLARPTASRGAWHKRALCPLADFSDACRLIMDTGSRTAKTRFLAGYLAALDNDADLATATRWIATDCQTRRAAANPRGNLGPTLRRAMLAIPGARNERLREIHFAQKDLIRSARILLQELQLHPQPLDLTAAAAFLTDFHDESASIARIERLAARLSTLHPAEGETLVRLLTNRLDLGMDHSLLLNAIAGACNADPAVLLETSTRVTDIGELAILARNRRLAEPLPPLPTPKTHPPTPPTPNDFFPE